MEKYLFHVHITTHAGQMILLDSCPPAVIWESGMIPSSISANSMLFTPINKIENVAILHMQTNVSKHMKKFTNKKKT